jgi:hypothetical protein
VAHLEVEAGKENSINGDTEPKKEVIEPTGGVA